MNKNTVFNIDTYVGDSFAMNMKKHNVTGLQIVLFYPFFHLADHASGRMCKIDAIHFFINAGNETAAVNPFFAVTGMTVWSADPVSQGLHKMDIAGFIKFYAEFIRQIVELIL